MKFTYFMQSISRAILNTILLLNINENLFTTPALAHIITAKKYLNNKVYRTVCHFVCVLYYFNISHFLSWVIDTQQRPCSNRVYGLVCSLWRRLSAKVEQKVKYWLLVDTLRKYKLKTWRVATAELFLSVLKWEETIEKKWFPALKDAHLT